MGPHLLILNFVHSTVQNRDLEPPGATRIFTGRAQRGQWPKKAVFNLLR